jgi:hypothetical protein
MGRPSKKLGYKLGCVAMFLASAATQLGFRLGMLAKGLAFGASCIAAVTDRLMILL